MLTRNKFLLQCKICMKSLWNCIKYMGLLYIKDNYGKVW